MDGTDSLSLDPFIHWGWGGETGGWRLWSKVSFLRKELNTILTPRRPWTTDPLISQMKFGLKVQCLNHHTTVPPHLDSAVLCNWTKPKYIEDPIKCSGHYTNCSNTLQDEGWLQEELASVRREWQEEFRRTVTDGGHLETHQQQSHPTNQAVKDLQVHCSCWWLKTLLMQYRLNWKKRCIIFFSWLNTGPRINAGYKRGNCK